MELDACYLVAVDLIRAIGEPQQARRRVGGGKSEIVGQAAAAMYLIAQSITTTLIIAISARASLLPTLSIK